MRLFVLLLALASCSDVAPTGVHVEHATPDYGPLVGGTTITLEGTGFEIGDRVVIAGREAPLARRITATTLELVIPPGDRTGDAEVLVIGARGTTTVTGVFRYSVPPTIVTVSPRDVLYSSSDTRVTLTGTGFRDEGAGEVAVLVDGRLAADIFVVDDTSLSFTAPSGAALLHADVQVVDVRGSATKPRAVRYTPSTRGGLLLFPPFSNIFAIFLDPIDNSTVTLFRPGPADTGYTTVVRDDAGDYWALDRNRRFGRIDMHTYQLENPIQTALWIPTMVRAGDIYAAIDRNNIHYGTFDPSTVTLTPVGDAAIPCCGSFGIAADGDNVWFTVRQGANVTINTIDPRTGAIGTPVTVDMPGFGFHVEEMRFFDHVLYAASRNGSVVTIDPVTGATTTLPINLGRFNAMEVFE